MFISIATASRGKGYWHTTVYAQKHRKESTQNKKSLKDGKRKTQSAELHIPSYATLLKAAKCLCGPSASYLSAVQSRKPTIQATDCLCQWFGFAQRTTNKPTLCLAD
jgi:hypothetical protein